jgi:hypothetical protein
VAQSKTDAEFCSELNVRPRVLTKLYAWFEELYSSEHWAPVGLCLPFALRDIGVDIVPTSIHSLFKPFTAKWLVEQTARLPLLGNCGMSAIRSIAGEYADQLAHTKDFSEILENVPDYVKRNSLKECGYKFLAEEKVEGSCLEELVGSWVVYSGNGDRLSDHVPGTWHLLDKKYGDEWAAGQLGRKNDGEQGRPVRSKFGEFKERAPGALPSRLSDCSPMEMLIMREEPLLFDYKFACSEINQIWRERDINSNSRPSMLVEVDITFGLDQCSLSSDELSYADLSRATVLEFVRFMLNLVHYEKWTVTLMVNSQSPLGDESVVMQSQVFASLASELSSANAFRWLRDRLPAMFEYDLAGPDVKLSRMSSTFDGHIKLLVCDGDEEVDSNKLRYQPSAFVKSKAVIRPEPDGECSWQVSHEGIFNGEHKGGIAEKSFRADTLSLSEILLKELAKRDDDPKESAGKPLSITVNSHE